MKNEIKALVKAGSVTASALGQSLGMAGLNIGKVVADVNNATKKYEGMKVPVTISYDLKTKDYEVIVGLPPTSQLILKEAGLEKAAADREALAGDITFEKLVGIVKTKKDSFGSDLKKGLLQVLGTCLSMGLTVDGKNPKIVQQEVKQGQHDSKLA
jgi:large subunit ribosomal protein L11